jgi:uridine kinase
MGKRLTEHAKQYPGKYAAYLGAIMEIDRVCQKEKETILVAIDGQSASGKTTMGEALRELYDCNLFHMDDFFLRAEQRTDERLREVGGNVDYERFKEEILDHLQDPDGFSYRPFSCADMALGSAVTVKRKRLNLIEGAYSQHPYFGDIYDLRLFYGIEPEEQKRRIAKRNGEKQLERFLTLWIPKENAYLEKFHIREQSITVE